MVIQAHQSSRPATYIAHAFTLLGEELHLLLQMFVRKECMITVIAHVCISLYCILSRHHTYLRLQQCLLPHKGIRSVKPEHPQHDKEVMLAQITPLEVRAGAVGMFSHSH